MYNVFNFIYRDQFLNGKKKSKYKLFFFSPEKNKSKNNNNNKKSSSLNIEFKIFHSTHTGLTISE